jgi:hypothetical protein
MMTLHLEFKNHKFRLRNNILTNWNVRKSRFVCLKINFESLVCDLKQHKVSILINSLLLEFVSLFVKNLLLHNLRFRKIYRVIF